MAEKDVHYNLSFYIYNVNVTRQKISFQVAAPKVNNTMVHLMDRNAFWIMVTLCIGRVALWQKVNITVLEIKQRSASFKELWWLLNTFMAKLILVKITLNSLQ